MKLHKFKYHCLNLERIVITGGPSTGKTSIIEKIKREGFFCFSEISREITLEARKQGIPQLFISDPLLFSQKIIEGRIKQFQAAGKVDQPIVFYDRGIPDVVAYMDCFGQSYDDHFVESCKIHRYDHIFYYRHGRKYTSPTTSVMKTLKRRNASIPTLKTPTPTTDTKL